MNEKITAAVQKRTDLWNRMKNYLDTAKRDGDTLTADALEQYERMENDLSALDREVDMLRRQQNIENRLNAPLNSPIVNTPTQPENEKIGRASEEYKSAFWQKVKNRYVPYEVMNALKVGVDSEGGYLAPDEFEKTLVQSLEEANIFRKIARVIQTSSGERKIPVVASHGTAAWLEEGAKIPETNAAFGQVTLGAYKMGAQMKASEELIQDSVFPIDTFIAQEFGRLTGAFEEEAFFVGTGSTQPTGIFAETGGAEIGITAQSATAITFDEIYDLYYSLKAPYRRNAVWLMNDSTVKAIRKLKDSNGQYLWQPSTGASTPDTLLNRPIYTSSYAPEVATGKKPIAFGDMSYYWIADRQGRSIKRLDEKYADEGMVGFIVTERVDGKLILPEAVKVLKMKAS